MAEVQHHFASGEPELHIEKEDIMRFAADHYNKHPKGKGAWNGRQIRNAFVVAAALARQEADALGLDAIQAPPRLRYEHFAEVEKLTREYDRFREQLLEGDDSFRARLLKERDDDYESDDEGQDSTERIELMRILFAAQKALASTAEKGKGKEAGA